MHRSIFTLVATLFASTVILTAPYAKAPRTAQSFNPSVTALSTVDEPSPFNLAYLAHQGYLKDQGIPDRAALVDATATRTMTAQDLMQAAIKAKRLPERTLSEQAYHFNLENQLQAFIEG